MTEVSDPFRQPLKAGVKLCLLMGWKGPTVPRPDVPKLSAQPLTCPQVSSVGLGTEPEFGSFKALGIYTCVSLSHMASFVCTQM